MVIVTVTLGTIVGAFVYYRWRRRRPLQSAPSDATEAQPVNATTSTVNRQQRRNRGVWRAEVIHGLPNYTPEARIGELSLGRGRKPSTEEEDYEMETRSPATTDQDSQPNSRLDVAERRTSRPTVSDSLPPYLPPPQLAVVAPATPRRL